MEVYRMEGNGRNGRLQWIALLGFRIMIMGYNVACMHIHVHTYAWCTLLLETHDVMAIVLQWARSSH